MRRACTRRRSPARSSPASPGIRPRPTPFSAAPPRIPPERPPGRRPPPSTPAGAGRSRARHAASPRAGGGRRGPVPEKSRFDVLRPQRLAEERVLPEIYLSDGEVVGGTPVRVEGEEGVVRHGSSLSAGACPGERLPGGGDDASGANP